MKRVVFVGLDGLEPTLAEAMMQAGALPHLAKMRHEGIWCRLQDYDDYRIGLVWEEFVLGTNADSNQRWSALAFDPQTSGGLLIALPDRDSADLISRLQSAGIKAATRIGYAVGPERVSVRLVR